MTLQLQLPLHCITLHCTTNYTTPQLQLQLQLHYTNYTTLQLQLQFHYTTTTTVLQHPAVVVRWPLQPSQPLQKTQLQPPFGPSVDSLCHPWFTTTNLSYRFPIFETSATALCGTTGILHIQLHIEINIPHIFAWVPWYPYWHTVDGRNPAPVGRWFIPL